MAIERRDLVELKKPERTPHGFLRGEMFATRTGVFEYPKKDGSGVVREYRDPSEVFHPDSLASYRDASFTDDHPAEFVKAENVRKMRADGLVIGYVPEPGQRADDHVRVPFVVDDEKAMAHLELPEGQGGKREVSCGYTCDLVWEPGIAPDGTHYDARQTNIRINHVALVVAGRAGKTARVRMDGVGVLVTSGNRVDTGAQEKLMKFAINGVTYDVTDEVAAAITKERADAAALVTAAHKERDTAQAKADGLADQLKTDPAKLEARAQARADVLLVARQHLGAEFKADGLTDRAIKAAVVEKLTGKKVEDSRSDDYVAGRFDIAIEGAGAGAEGLAAARTVAAGERTDAAPPDVKAAHASYLKSVTSPWNRDAGTGR